MSVGYARVTLVRVRDAGDDQWNRYICEWSDGGALAVSSDATAVWWVEHDFDPWVFARPVPFTDLAAPVQEAIQSIAAMMREALTS